MATKNDYPSYLPEDFRGLPSVPDGNRRLYYRLKQDGTKLLYGEIITKSRIIIRYPAGSTIEVVPPNSISSEEIRDESIEKRDLRKDVQDSIDKIEAAQTIGTDTVSNMVADAIRNATGNE